MRRLPVLALALTAALASAGCSRAEDADFGAKVRAYLLEHPEVIKEAIDKYNENMEAKQQAAARDAIGKNRAALERNPGDYVANPNGKITVVEFYDYRCPHCINVAPKVLDFIAKNPDVRFVFKEMPIFGDASDRAAAGALAVKAAGGDYLAAYKDMMTTRPLNNEAIDRIVKAHGVDPAVLDKPETLKPLNDHLAEVHDLAGKIGVDGTPAFIIGDTMVPGEDMDAVKAAVAAERKKTS